MDLLGLLTDQLGISDEQAAGGAGMILKMAKDALGGDFSQITDAIPELSGLVDQAPESNGLMGAIGGLASSFGGGDIGSLLSLGSGFSKLGLDADMIPKFIPIILDFVNGNGGSGIMNLLSKVLK